MVISLLNIEIDGSSENSIKFGAKKLVQYIKPEWNNEDLNYKIYTDGISNKLVGVWNQNFNDQVLVRVYGEKTELFIDRNAERDNFKLLHVLKLGPELYATFKNGLCYAFVPGNTLTVDSIREKNIWPSIAQRMAELHKIKVEDGKACLFSKIKNFIDILPSEFTGHLANLVEGFEISKSYLENECSELEVVLTSLNCPIVFCHNDLLVNNIIWNGEQKCVSFIDLEYAAPNFQPFDIANHFNEFAGVDIFLDYETFFPTADFQRTWIQKYLSFYFDKPETEITIEEVEKWRVWVCKFTLASHLLWGSWGLVQSCHSSIDFDFAAYGGTRLKEYMKRKQEFLEL